MRVKAILTGVVLLALSGCASPTLYERAERLSEGYSDQRLTENRYRITFRGNSATHRETVENYLLLRSAEVTLEAGYSWFEFDERDTRAKTTYHSAFTGYPGWGLSWRHLGRYWRTWPYDPWDPFWGRGGDAVPSTKYDAYAEIVLLLPDAAEKDIHAINAKDVIAHLGPAATPPPLASKN